MFGLSPSELSIIAVIVLLIFGARRLPEIGKGLGGAIRELRNIRKEVEKDGNGSEIQGKKADAAAGEERRKSLEARLGDKALKQIPGVKKMMDVKKKAEKVKDLLK